MKNLMGILTAAVLALATSGAARAEGRRRDRTDHRQPVAGREVPLTPEQMAKLAEEAQAAVLRRKREKSTDLPQKLALIQTTQPSRPRR